MTISSTSALSPLTATSAPAAVTTTQNNTATTSTADTNPLGSFRTQLSKLGELMSKLQDLEKSNPDKAKQVLTSIASTLKDKATADGTTDPHLQALADKFTQAANTGDLSVLRPHAGGGHHHHHAQGAAPAATGDAPATGDAAAAGDTSDPAAAHGPAAKIASYLHGAADRLAQLDSIISDALSSAT